MYFSFSKNIETRRMEELQKSDKNDLESAALTAVLAALAAYFASIAIIGFFAVDVESEQPELSSIDFILGLAPLHLAGACAALVVMKQMMSKLSLRQICNFGRFREINLVRRLKLWIRTIFLGLAIVAIASLASLTLFNYLGIPPEPTPMHLFLSQPLSPVAWVIIAGGAVVVAPLAEEFIFRRLLPLAFARVHLPAAWVLSALIFAFIHGSPAYAPGLFLLALLLNKSAKQPGGLRDCIAIHAGYNATVLVIFVLATLGDEQANFQAIE